ncbi:Photosystem I reaction center subunit III [Leptolyngbya sp. FACHB-17]|uniref:Photosystem I reaction center subunit III n=1 Tax=unclassified Leptolyngbya TaxID=2650499 RepID=UPI0016812313|nr:Photosystem I reaction center subunit III [Leptolyngbya sp. FACHB-17]MBD2082971.1 Photosystem I reaction center subunit III [Leptolyngbya sp. FACHB-17]
MQRLFALVLAIFLGLGFVNVQPAHAYNLTPCSENEVFAQRIQDSQNATARRRLELYAEHGLLCGKDDGLPHLITDGNLKHVGEFTLPGLLFLYIAGWIGYSGRSYLNAAKKAGNPEEKEIIIDVPLAISCVLPALLWPLLSIQELLAGTLIERDDRIPVGADSLLLNRTDKRKMPSQAR